MSAKTTATSPAEETASAKTAVASPAEETASGSESGRPRERERVRGRELRFKDPRRQNLGHPRESEGTPREDPRESAILETVAQIASEGIRGNPRERRGKPRERRGNGS